MNGGLFLMVATDGLHSLAGKKYPHRVWTAGQPEPGKAACMDVVQVISLDKDAEAKADEYFPDSNKYYDGDTVIYAHPSLEKGMFTSGYFIPRNKELCEFLNGIGDGVKFMSGLFLDTQERTSGQMVPLLHEEEDVHWHTVHPSNFFTNCFDGYGMVDIQNMYSLKVDINCKSWLNLNRQHFRWLEMTEMKYFPMIIHPFRIDVWEISARWEQPTEYPEIYQLNLWNDPKIPSSNRCGCGYYQIPNYEPTSPLHMELITEVAVRKKMKYLYHNQNREGIKAAYTNGGGVGHFHFYLSSEFGARVTKLMIRDGVHLTAEQYEQLRKKYDQVMAEQIAEDQQKYDKLCDDMGEKRGESYWIHMKRAAGIGYMARKKGLVLD